ncbi:uncharacterized protein [Arachis hypogaea]|uniref:uncharacterized protein n=1 Tax=Arachis hypogaea TaxID=3818 RepID=UPI003B228989
MDASGHGIGTLLSKQGHPITYFSKKFNQCLLVASAYIRELCAITQAVAKWWHYLLGIGSALRPIIRLMHALSRRGEESSEACLQAFSTVNTSLTPSLLRAMREDLDTQLLIEKYQKGALPPKYLLQEGLLMYKGKLYVSDFESIRTQLLIEFHTSPMAGHPGELKTYKAIGDLFFWPGQ